MNAVATQPRHEQSPDEQRSWLHGEVDGRQVAFWIVTGLAIAGVTLGLGAWWVWGLGRAMPTDDAAMDGTAMEASETIFGRTSGCRTGVACTNTEVAGMPGSIQVVT